MCGPGYLDEFPEWMQKLEDARIAEWVELGRVAAEQFSQDVRLLDVAPGVPLFWEPEPEPSVEFTEAQLAQLRAAGVTP